jgi:hypothetical protein
VAFRGLLLEDLIQMWVAEQDRVHAAPAPSPQPTPVAVVKPVPAKPAAKPVVPMTPVAPAEPAKPKPRPLRKDTVAVGGRLVSVLRSGIDIDGFQCRAGDQIALPAEQAELLVRAGSCDYVNAGENQ